MNKTTHLVLGASGFVGRHVVQQLALQGHHVITAGRRPPPPLHGARDVRHTPFDLTEPNWDRLTADCDIIHHYAWVTGPAMSPLEGLEQNVGSLITLLDSMRRQRCKRLVFASSGGTVYGHLHTVPAPEEHPLNPISPYGALKVAAEKYIGVFCTQHGLEGRIARLSNPFGAGQNPTGGQGAVAAFMDRALKDQQAIIWGDGSVVRDYIHISDAAEALTRLSLAALPARLQVFNIGSGEGLSLNQIVAAIRDVTGRALPAACDAARPTDIPVSILDISHARDQLGWTPVLAFREGLTRMRDDLLAGRTSYSRPV